MAARSNSKAGSTTVPLDLAEIIVQQAERYKDKVYIDSVDQRRTVSYAQLLSWCNRIGNYFESIGLQRGQVVSVIGRNALETLLIYFGTMYYGAIVNPINVEESSLNINRILDYVKPELVLYDSKVPLDQVSVGPGRRMAFALEGEATALNGGGEFFSALAGLSDRFENAARRPDDIAEYVFTSGTTSFPKGAVITHKALCLMAQEVAERLALTDGDVFLEYRNYNWLSSQTLSILPSFVSGASLVFGRRFSRSRFAGWVKNKKVTISAGVPTVINILVHDPVELHRDDVPHLRLMTSSSAPLSVESQEAFETHYGIPILQMAGMTEAGFVLGTPPGARKLGSAGPPCRYKEVRFLDQDNNPLPPGAEGEMVISGESMALGYVQGDRSIQRFPKEGFRTGDLGYADPDGYVYITGRVKDLIIKGGVNIAPAEITNRILSHPAVKEAVTIGVPDAIYGENVGAFVVAKEGAAVCEEDIVGYCRETLPPFKVPAQVHFVGEIPKTERGKVTKESLLDLLRRATTGSGEGAVLQAPTVPAGQ